MHILALASHAVNHTQSIAKCTIYSGKQYVLDQHAEKGFLSAIIQYEKGGGRESTTNNNAKGDLP